MGAQKDLVSGTLKTSTKFEIDVNMALIHAQEDSVRCVHYFLYTLEHRQRAIFKLAPSF